MSRLSRPLIITIIVFSIFNAGCVGNQTPSSDAASEGQGAGSGRLFVLKDIHGQSVSLADELKKNKAVLVNFWATWCPPCREEIPGLIELQTKHRDDGFTVLGVDVGESAAKVEAFARKYNINYPVLLDSDQDAAAAFGIVGIPTSLLMNAEGKVLGEYHSYNGALVRDVEEALK